MNLQTPLEKIFRITADQQKTLKKMAIFTVADLLYHFPTRYGDFSKISNIAELSDGDITNIYAEVISIKARKTFKTNIPITEATLKDSSGEELKAIWFSQPYIYKMLPAGSLARFSGTVSVKNGKKLLSNPEFGKLDSIPLEKTGSLFLENSTGSELALFPVYKESGVKKGKISSKWIYHKIKKILADSDFVNSISDPIPEEILKKYKLPSLKNSFFYLHLPKNTADAEAAKKRFAFEEIFMIQLAKGIEREKYQKSGAFIIKPEKKLQKEFLNSFGFTLTNGQSETIDSILTDFKRGLPMSRLLEGDVGSGKTVVAAAAAFFAATTKPKNQNFGKIQVAYMAPTEILAKQIFAEFIKILGPYGISIALLTSKDVRRFPSKVSKNEAAKIPKKKLAEAILNGEIQVTVGTHALISKNIFFENLGLVIIDEQHRFGKKQRASLRAKPVSKTEAIADGKIKKLAPKSHLVSEKIIKKGLAENEDILPHLLSMTATPIPRTLALSLYGDLDLSLMTDMPAGRKKVLTEIYIDNESQREKVYKSAKKELDNGRQMYVICPRIDDPDPDKAKALNVKSATSTQKKLQKDKYFKNFKIGLLHSKMKKEQKDKVMEDFLNNKYQILVSTSVIEVGVSVANATVMIIEGGERFGLSQLHQFRGRVMRSTFQPYCYIFANTKNEKTLERLKAIREAKNGFELAEYDLQFRGAGQILGNKQSGMSDLAMEAIRNLKMVEAARKEAQKMAKGEKYKKYKNLSSRLEEIIDKVYME